MNKNINNFNFIETAYNVFKRNLMRSLLTVFGIMVGIAMVILVLSAGHGVKSIVLEEISSFGDNWINIEIKVPSAARNSFSNASSIAQGVSITTLTEADKDAVVRLPSVKQAYAGVTSQATISFESEKKQVTIFGVTSEYFDISKGEVVSGSVYTKQDEERLAQVVVLGSEISETLFGNTNAVGEFIKLDGKSYRVSAVMEPLGATTGFDMDNIIYVPLQTVQKRIMGIDHVLWFVADLKDTVTNSELVAEEIREILRDRHNITDPEKSDFAVTTFDESIEIVGTILFGITWLLVALSAISLLVGGVGIMNVMYVSVVERTFEIGLRKSVGASAKDIQKQFLTEAIVITSIGGVLGILFGIILSALISFGAAQGGINWPFYVSPLSVILSVSFSASIGLIFGYYPAKQAASLDPIVALRQE